MVNNKEYVVETFKGEKDEVDYRIDQYCQLHWRKMPFVFIRKVKKGMVTKVVERFK